VQAIGVVEGREAIVIEHVTRLAPDVAPDWPTLRGARAGAMAATAMPVVNAVPYVIAAPAGLLSSVDLPMTIPRGAAVG
jgi:2,4-diaminopentanoate dehydrogenase